MSTRQQILESIRTALKDSPVAPEIPRDYRRSDPQTTAERIQTFADRIEDYKASAIVVSSSDVPATIEKLLTGSSSYAVPADFDPLWLSSETRPDRRRVDGGSEGRISADVLDSIDAVVTASSVAVAESGTIILDGGPSQGRRIISLIPDHHICVVRVQDIVAILPEALARIDGTRPITMISGPSATSDIDLERVEGVHGPRRLDVIIALDSTPDRQR